MINIETYKFNKDVVRKLEQTKFGNKWPIVYIINNNKEAYIGETTNAYMRASQHLDNPKRQVLNLISIISSEKFNKSVVLDLESFLIKYMVADRKFKLQNGNSGLQYHDYYQREMYEAKFKDIWEKLREKGIVQNDLKVIENSNLFKYSPYKSLTPDQYDIVNKILNKLADDIKSEKKSTFIVHGGAGTGKTILGIYLIKLLTEAKDNYININEEDLEEDLEDDIKEILKIHNSINNLKVGLVIPMSNLRATLKKVFREVKGLNPKMVLSPNDVANSNEIYDLLIVDESHRLRKRENLTNYKSFDKNNKKFNLGDNGNELDWIRLQSKYQIFLYDEEQTIKPTDIDKEEFETIENKENTYSYSLKTQLRCLLGGNEYVQYVKEIFSNNPPKKAKTFKEYDFKIFDNIEEMVNSIKSKNEVYGLCRTVAGFAWKWKNRKKNLDEIINNNLYEIEIDGHKYIWNTQKEDWINSPNAINEIGCIHTTQGFDLNYTGLIIGNELKYDDVNHKIYVDRSNYYDQKGKSNTTDKQLLEYILHIYATMCTRGMRGTYLYICDEKLREYLNNYIEIWTSNGITYSIDEENENHNVGVAEEGEEYRYE